MPAAHDLAMPCGSYLRYEVSGENPGQVGGKLSPIFDNQTRHAPKLIAVAGTQSSPKAESLGCDECVQRADRCLREGSAHLAVGVHHLSSGNTSNGATITESKCSFRARSSGRRDAGYLVVSRYFKLVRNSSSKLLNLSASSTKSACPASSKNSNLAPGILFCIS
jgi:hypothetical protein